jgi:GR25 family glycosyltransferase involved in LPS biosynthesis
MLKYFLLRLSKSKKTINNILIKPIINKKNKKIIETYNILENSKYNYDIIDDSLLEIKLDYYIIHLKRSDKRKDNIIKVKEVLNKEITVFDAIDGNDIIDINDNIIFKNTIIEAPFTFDQSIKTKLTYGEIGNYLSHLSLLYKLKDVSEGYTIIFEDDIIFKSNLDNIIRGILGKIKIDFDILFLGNNKKNYGEKYIDEIYYIDKNNVLWGTHAYLINNKNINKIYSNFNYLLFQTDLIFKDLINNDKLNCLILEPSIVLQNYKEYPSEIFRRKSNNFFLLKYLKKKKSNV